MKISENTRLGEPHHIGTIGDLCLRIIDAKSRQNVSQKLVRNKQDETKLNINFQP